DALPQAGRAAALTLVSAGQRWLTLRQRPGHVLAHQRARVPGARLQRLREGGVARFAPRVAQAHRQVAQPAFVADAADRAAFGAAQEHLLRPREELDQADITHALAGVEVGQRRALRELVPGADELAVVAAVDAVAHGRAQRLGNGP